MRYIKDLGNGSQTEKKGDISFILKYRPNELMTPSQFIYKVVSLMVLNDNAFVYPLYDKYTYELKGVYPLKPILVEPAIDNIGGLFLKFYFEDGTNYMLPYEKVLHKQ